MQATEKKWQGKSELTTSILMISEFASCKFDADRYAVGKRYSARSYKRKSTIFRCSFENAIWRNWSGMMAAADSKWKCVTKFALPPLIINMSQMTTQYNFFVFPFTITYLPNRLLRSLEREWNKGREWKKKGVKEKDGERKKWLTMNNSQSDTKSMAIINLKAIETWINSHIHFTLTIFNYTLCTEHEQYLLYSLCTVD